MLGRLLCFLGIHKWSDKTHVFRYCVRCRKYWLMPWVRKKDEMIDLAEIVHQLDQEENL